MPDVRKLMEDLVAHPVAPAPAVEEIGRRAGVRRHRRRTALAVVAVVALATGPVRWATGDSDGPTHVASEPTEDSVPQPEPSPGSPGTTAGSHAVPPSSDTRQEGLSHVGPEVAPAVQCKAGHNGGATDVGVTGSRIDLLMRATLDGPAKSILEDAPRAVKSVVDRVNRAGGICGRLLSVWVVNDTTGHTWHESPDHYLAGLVGPLQAGFDQHIADGTIDRFGMPLVGTDGLTSAQFRSDFVWPVGTSAAASARIAVDHAYRTLGARSFAVVYDKALMREAEVAFRAYVERLPGAVVVSTTGVDPSDPSYGTETEAFNQACGDERCDVVVLAVLPETAKKWLQAGAAPPRQQMAGLPSLMTDGFGHDCVRLVGSACDGFRVWSGFTPPIGSFTNDPEVGAYAAEDFHGAPGLVEGAYVGAQVLVEALKRMGPLATRERLQNALAEMAYSSGLVSTIDWHPVSSGRRGGNVSARAVDLRQGSFEDAGTGWVADPAPY